MISLDDEGFTDNDVEAMRRSARSLRQDLLLGMMSVHEREGAQPSGNVINAGFKTDVFVLIITELVYDLLRSLPRSSLARIQRNIAPLLQLDVVGVSKLISVLEGNV